MCEGGTPVADVLAARFGDDNSARLTFRAACAGYIAHATSRKRASSLADDAYRLGVLGRAPWAGKLLAKVTPADLMAWADDRQRPREVERLRPRRDGETIREFRSASDRWVKKPAPGAAAPTVNKDLHLVSAIYQWAIRAELVGENPVKRVAFLPVKGRECEVYLTSDECDELLDSCPDVLRPIAFAAIHTGMRKGELLALRWRSIDLDRREMRVESATSKSGKGRTVPMTEALHARLVAARASRKRPALDGSDFVFVIGDGSPLGRSALRSMFERAVERCPGVPLSKRQVLRFHDLRHTAASLMVAAGVPIFDVAKILGHSTVATTMRYAHFAPEAGRTAIDRLGAVLGRRKARSTATRAGEVPDRDRLTRWPRPSGNGPARKSRANLAARCRRRRDRARVGHAREATAAVSPARVLRSESGPRPSAAIPRPR